MAEKINFTTMVSVSKLAKGGRGYVATASGADLKDIAKRLELHNISKFTAIVNMEDRGRSKGVYIEGDIKTEFEQYCVVSLEPHPVSLDIPFTLRLVGGEELERLDEAEAYLDPEVEEYDALEGDEIDLGEILVQTLSMEIDPNARFVDLETVAQSSPKVSVNEGTEKKPNPFAKLEILKNKT